VKILDKKDLIKVIRNWADSYRVICPSKISHNETIFDAFDEKTFTLDYTKPSLPPKTYYLPQSETIFTVENGEYTPVESGEKTILFGIRACDMTGILQSASFMDGDVNDIFYNSHSNNTITVVMACAGPQNDTCFCTTTQSGPYAKKGYDLQLYDLGESFLVAIGSETGSELTAIEGFSDIDDADALDKMQSFQQRAEQLIEKIPEFAQALDRLSNEEIKDDFWDRFGDKCIICGGCTFVCPTCTCFNVVDRQTSAQKGDRIRTWDACLYGGFTKEASGHNPRSSQGIRLKRRHEHKLLYYHDRDTHGALCTCVGCGRCSDYCPVHIGTIEIVKALAGEKD